MKIDAKIVALPVGHLQLKGRARRATSDYKTIAEVITAVQRFQPWGSGTALNISRVIRILGSATARKGMNAWDIFRRSRPPLAHPRSIFFTSPNFRRLTRSIVNGPLAKLHLNRRAITALNRVGVSTIGELIDSARDGIVELPVAGERTCFEITEALEALVYSIRLDGNVDWITYAKQRQFVILPSIAKASYSTDEFLRLFPKICEVAVNSKFGRAGMFVLRKRLLRPPDTCPSLSEVGRHLNQTAERIRLLERSILKLLSRAIWSEEYRGCRFRLRPTFLDPLCRLESALRRLGNRPLPSFEWHRVLRECWALTHQDLGEQEALLLHLLGFEPVVSSHVSMIRPKLKTKPRTASVATEANRVLMQRCTEWLSADQVWEFLRKHLRSAAPERGAVPTLLRAMPGVEGQGGRYRIKWEKLTFRTERCERVLRDRGSPMHYRQIASEVDRRCDSKGRGTSPRKVAILMARCDRFSAIGRTGLWSLREWKHIETGTVADVAARVLSGSTTPLTEKELFSMISPRRPVRLKSIATLLGEDSRFLRVAPAKWALKRKNKLGVRVGVAATPTSWERAGKIASRV